jgi:hypothetical protein
MIQGRVFQIVTWYTQRRSKQVQEPSVLKALVLSRSIEPNIQSSVENAQGQALIISICVEQLIH